MKADVHLSRALMKLPMEGDLSQEVKDELAKFVCSRYCVRISSIPDLRWYLFCKQLAESKQVTTYTWCTRGTHQLQSRVRCQATVMQQQPLDPLQFGYYMDTDGQLLPLTTKVLPAPQAIIELVRCQCRTNCSTQRCSCRRNNLPCLRV